MKNKYVPLKDIAEKITDGTHHTPKYVDSGVVFLSATNIKSERLVFQNCKFITEEEHRQLKKRCFPEPGDILLSKSGALGDAAIVPETEFEFSVFESLALIKLKKDLCYPPYLKQYLNSPRIKTHFRSITSGLAVKHLHLVDLKKVPVYLPDLETQKSIADFFDVFDSMTEKNGALLLAKERQMKWLMDKLIKSQESNWKKSKLGETVHIKKGKQLNKLDMIENGKFPAQNGGINPSGYTDNWNTEENTITISEGGNSCGFVNFNTQKFWCGGHCYALLDLDAEVDRKYLYYYLKAHEAELMALRVGSGLPNIQMKEIEKFSLASPKIEHQKEIVRVLDTAQQEIALLKSVIHAYRTQKRAFMHRLFMERASVNSKEVAA